MNLHPITLTLATVLAAGTDPLLEFFNMTLWFFYIIGMVFCFTAFPLFILFWKKWMPAPARLLFWAARRRLPILLLVHDSGRGELTTIKERKGEGIVITAQGKYKILPRVSPKMPLHDMIVKKLTDAAKAEQDKGVGTGERAEVEVEVDLPEGTDKKTRFNLDFLKKNFILDYTDYILKRCYLVGMGLPFFVGYTGKLCLLNPEALALYEAGEMMVRTEDGTMFNPQDLKDKSMKKALKPLLLIDPRKIQQVIYNGFDQSQIAGVVADTEELMRVGKGFLSGKFGLVMILVIVLIIGLALFIVPQMLPQESPPAGIIGSAIQRITSVIA